MRRPDLGLLRHRPYANLFAAVTATAVGYQVTTVAFPLVAVLALDASEFAVGLLAALSSLALAIFGLPAGAWVDRLRKRRVLIVSDLIRAVLILAIPVLWWMGQLSMWHLYVIAAASGAASIFFDVASQSFLPALVGRDRLVEANAKQESVRQVAQLAGPAVAGQIIVIVTAPVSLVVTGVALLVSAAFTARIGFDEPLAERAPDSTLWSQIGEGLRFVLRDPLLRVLSISTAWSNLCSAVYHAMALVFLARTLGLSPGTIGVMMSIGAIGGLAGAVLVRRVVARLGQGPTMCVVFALGSPFWFVLPMVGADWRIWLAAGATAVMSFCGVVYNITLISARQNMAPDALQGRVNATMRFFNWCTIPVGAFVGGVLGEVVGARETLFIGAAGALLAFLPLVLSPLRTMRELPSRVDTPTPATEDRSRASTTPYP
ncbi:MFS transporter [Stackebrandtia soli]|uniref:MFS transporter n=1 Tax=Stackebrandtia soli TaxID=1892856 RepID=UPI0039E98340